MPTSFIATAANTISWTAPGGVPVAGNSMSYFFQINHQTTNAEGSRVIEVSVESGGGMPSIIIGPDAFARWRSGVPIPREEQERILQNFRKAMEFQGLRFLID